nr:macro domain-containing protein [uncultured Clostridium sp.]
MLKYYSGDIFTSDADIICHQVNCQGVFERGIAGQIKKMFPEVEKTYRIITKQWQEQSGQITSGLLGRVSAQPVELNGRWFLIANLYGQDNYGKNGVYTDYKALSQAVNEIRDFVDVRGRLEKVAFPYGIGCGNAGGDWDKVEEILNSCFSDYQGEVQIWKNDSE